MQDLVGSMPGAVAVIVVVVFFLRHISSFSETIQKMLERHNAHLTEMQKSCHTVQSQATEAIRQNAQVIGENTEILRKTNDTLEKANRRKEL